jgi:deoxyribose-phosphate aldolase
MVFPWDGVQPLAREPGHENVCVKPCYVSEAMDRLAQKHVSSGERFDSTTWCTSSPPI